jgi:iron complex transport system substrate-binding protein
MPHLIQRWLIACFAVLALSSGALAQPIKVSDETGFTASFDKPVTRIVALNRYNTEFVRAVAGSQAIAGLDRDAWIDRDYWPEVEEARVVAANQGEIDYEKIVAQAPDVVMIPRNGAWQEARQKLAPFKIPVLVLTGWDVLKHEENIALLGKLTGQSDRAAKLNAFYRKHIDLLAARIANVELKKVYFEADRENVTVLKGSGWHDMIAAAGGKSLFGDLDMNALPASNRNVNIFTVEPETVAAANPDVVLRLTPAVLAAVPEEKARALAASLKARPALVNSNAVKNGQVYLMSYYVAGGVSKMVGALQLAKWLHPDRFADVDPDAVMREWIEVWQGKKYPGQHTYVVTR